MKTLLSAVLGVGVAVAGIAGYASLGNATSHSVAPPASLAQTVSFANTAAHPAGAALSHARAVFDEMTDHAQSPPATVDDSTIRQVGSDSFMALRSDGSVCLSQRTTLNCYTAYEPGGIATTVGDGRAWDSETAPFNVVVDGIARDGVTAVTFRLTDGSTFRAPVVDNAFTLTVPDHVANDLAGYSVSTASGVVGHTFPAGHFPKVDAPLKRQG